MVSFVRHTEEISVLIVFAVTVGKRLPSICFTANLTLCFGCHVYTREDITPIVRSISGLNITHVTHMQG